ncbi:MAG: ankyrin repeat domain-containing protein, partial [Burkholderiales bacterium]
VTSCTEMRRIKRSFVKSTTIGSSKSRSKVHAHHCRCGFGSVEDGITYLPTPLMMATMMGHKESARLLLEAGANPRLRVAAGNTAIEFAVKYRQTHMFTMLRCAEGLPRGQKFSQWCEGAASTDTLIPVGLFRRQ